MELKQPKEKMRFVNPLLCSAVEFARMSGLSAGLIRRMIGSGELPSRLIGTRRWILRAEAVEWLRNQTLESETASLNVDNRLTTAIDPTRAADLFQRILRAVSEQQAEDDQRKQPPAGTAA
jgi:hypothetical protein